MQTIGIINPSMVIEPFCPTRFKRAVNNLTKAGYRVVLGELTNNTNEIYRSGTIAQRVNEFNNMVSNPEIDIIMVSIGGQNTASIIDQIDYELVKKNPKKYIGYSDATSLLHALKTKANQQVYYGMSLTSSFGEIGYFTEESLKQLNLVINETKFTYVPSEFVTNQYIDWEEQTEEKIKYPNSFKTYKFKSFSGRLVGGNLTTLSALAGTEYMIKRKANDIIYLETEGTDIGMLEKYLVHLKQIGYFNEISGIILGKTEFIKDYGLNRSLVSLIEEILQSNQVPIYDGFDAAHTHPSTLIELGAFISVTLSGEIRRIRGKDEL